MTVSTSPDTREDVRTAPQCATAQRASSLENVSRYFDVAADRLGLTDGLRDVVRTAEREVGAAINSGNAGCVRARIVVEGANGPTTAEADEILNDNGVLVIPDVLANAGGVIVSYFEWAQNLQRLSWDEHEVNDRLLAKMRRAYREVEQRARGDGVSLRVAAYELGIERVIEGGSTPRAPGLRSVAPSRASRRSQPISGRAARTGVRQNNGREWKRPYQRPKERLIMPEHVCHVNVAFSADGDRTRADAVLELAGHRFHGFGQAKRSPEDPRVPAIGEELAAARALSALAHQLLHVAAERIESFEGHPSTPHG